MNLNTLETICNSDSEESLKNQIGPDQLVCAMEELLANPLKAKLGDQPDKNELFKFLNDDEKKCIHKKEGALLTLLVEARRRKWSKEKVEEYVETLGIDPKEVTDAFEETRSTIDDCLQNTAIRRSRLVGYKVEPYFEVYNSRSGRVNQPKCRVVLDLMKSDSNSHEEYSMICNLNELQSLVTDLRDMQHILRRRF